MNLQVVSTQKDNVLSAFQNKIQANDRNDSFREYLQSNGRSSIIQQSNNSFKSNQKTQIIARSLELSNKGVGAKDIHNADFDSIMEQVLKKAKDLGFSKEETSEILKKLQSLLDQLNSEEIELATSVEEQLKLLNEEGLAYISDVFANLTDEDIDIFSKLVDALNEDFNLSLSFLTSLAQQFTKLEIDEAKQGLLYEYLNDLSNSSGEKEQLLNNLYLKLLQGLTEEEQFPSLTKVTIANANETQSNGPASDQFNKLFALLRTANAALQSFEQSEDMKAGRLFLNDMQLVQKLSSELAPEELKHLLREAGVLERNESKFIAILQNLNRISEISTRSTYMYDSSLNTKDLKQWLAHIEANLNLSQVTLASVNQEPKLFQSQSALNHIEQYVLHANQAEDLSSNLSKLLNRNQFFQIGQALNGNQMTIHLRPEHLGEMVVRFQQIDGETVVKLIVASAGAKQLLESNLNQLKNMFSPHQIIIESREESSIPEVNKENEQMAEDRNEEADERHQEEQQDDSEQTMNFKGILDNLFQEGV